MLGKVAQEAVGHGVVALARIAEHTDDGREAQEVIQRAIGRGRVEVDRAPDLGVQHLPDFIEALGEDEAIPDHAGAVQDTVDPAVGGTDAAHHLQHRLGIGDVADAVLDVEFQRTQRGELGLPRFVECAAAEQHHGGPGCLRRHRAAQQVGDAAESAGDQVHATPLPEHATTRSLTLVARHASDARCAPRRRSSSRWLRRGSVPGAGVATGRRSPVPRQGARPARGTSAAPAGWSS